MEDKMKNQGKECRDHLGNKYPTISKMCESYNIPIYTYENRIGNSWSLEKALTTPLKRTVIRAQN
jgi:hypothetical protein